MAEEKNANVPELSHEQIARISALKASREVLSEKSGGAFSSHTAAVDTIDLVNIASWIINGKDPWKSYTVNPVFVAGDRLKPYGRCAICGSAQNDDQGECTNPDCVRNNEG
jgi:hypothetical protein